MKMHKSRFCKCVILLVACVPGAVHADEGNEVDPMVREAAPTIAAFEAAIQGKAHPKLDSFIAPSATWEGVRPLTEVVTDATARAKPFPDDSQLRWLTSKAFTDAGLEAMVPDRLFPEGIDRDKTILVFRDVEKNTEGDVFRLLYWFSPVQGKWMAVLGHDGWGPADPLQSLSEPVPPTLLSGAEDGNK